MDTEEPGKRVKSYRGWWIVAGVVVLAAAIVVLLWLNGQHRLQRKIEQLHAKGFPITFEGIEQKRKLPEGTPNAADLYQQAFDAFIEPSKEDSPLLAGANPSKLREPWKPLSKETVAAIDRLIKNNQQTIDLLRQAATVKDCCFQLNYLTTPLFYPTILGLHNVVALSFLWV